MIWGKIAHKAQKAPIFSNLWENVETVRNIK